ncbi:hypothetical protein AB6A23_17450 [Paenibacillus tarimensis]
MIMKKATACAAVFALLLLLGWQADRRIPSGSSNIEERPEGQPHLQQLKISRYDGFRPREYVRMIRYGEQLSPDKNRIEPEESEPDRSLSPSNTY